MNAATWAVVLATLVGPILAVQAQKWIERLRAVDGMREMLFQHLMTTRHDGARTSRDHVTALNMIDIAFYGRRVWKWAWRSEKCQSVLNSWKEYFDHLNLAFPEDDASQRVYCARRDELFVNLLLAISQERGYNFDRVALKRGCYLPVAAVATGGLDGQLRQAWLDVALGRTAISVIQATARVSPEIRPAE